MVTSYAFDSRPGLKFLIQKIFSSPVPANLYKMAVSGWTLKLLSLYELTTLAIDEELTAKRVSELCGDVKKRAMIRLPEPPSTTKAAADPLFYLQFMFRAYMIICCRCCELLEKTDERRGETEADWMGKRPLMLLASEFQDKNLPATDSEPAGEDQSGLLRDAAVVKDVESCSASSASSVENLEGEGNSKIVDENATESGAKEKVYSLATNDTVNAVLSGKSL